MKQKKFIFNFIEIADIHANRLRSALNEVDKLIPLTAVKLERLDDGQVAFLDMMATRFGKLQDVIGGKIFPLILEVLAEDAQAFIDKLNRLEKLGYLEDANWWIELREIRNQITHDYPDNYKTLAKHFNVIVKKAADLLRYWGELKGKINSM